MIFDFDVPGCLHRMPVHDRQKDHDEVFVCILDTDAWLEVNGFRTCDVPLPCARAWILCLFAQTAMRRLVSAVDKFNQERRDAGSTN